MSASNPTSPPVPNTTAPSASATPLPVTSSAIQQAPLPPSHLFDVLPALHALLSRLEPSLNTYTSDTLEASQAANGASTSIGSGLARTSSNEPATLTYKDVITAASAVNWRMRKALAELGKLGDMDRDIDEQEEEIRELEDKIERQKRVLARLSEHARSIGPVGEARVAGETG